MAIDTARTVATLRGLTARFDISASSAVPYYPTKCVTMPSNGRDEGYGGLGAVPQMREWLGERQFGALGSQQFALPNREWENSFAVERNDIEDDRLNMYGPMFDNLGKVAVLHPDQLVFQVQQAGTTGICMDGQPFYNTSHQMGQSGVQSNLLTYGMSVTPWVASTAYVAGAIVRNGANQYTCVTGGTSAGAGGPTTLVAAITDNTVTWNYSGPVLPTENDVRNAYNIAQAQMLTFKMDNGMYFNSTEELNSPQSDFILEVPTALNEICLQALFKTLINPGQSNLVINRPMRVVQAALLNSDPLSVYLHKVGGPMKPFVFQARRPLARTMKGLDDREFKAVKFMADARYNVGYYAWWNSVKLTFA